MNKKSLIPFLATFLFFQCTSEKTALVNEFTDLVHNLDLENLEKITTENTIFYLRLATEPILVYGDEVAKEQLMEIASSVNCNKKEEGFLCRYLDENGIQQRFNISFVNSQSQKETLLIDIDELNF